jgi:hypothetical protein
MSYRPRFARAVLVALGLSLMLLVDGLASAAAQSAENSLSQKAASAEFASAAEALMGESPPPAGEAVVCDAGRDH